MCVCIATSLMESKGAAITDVDEKEIDTIFRMVAAAKKNGIYILISPYWYHRKIPASWGLAGYKKGDMPVGSLFWNKKYQDAFKVWCRALYTTENPYTGLKIVDDPTVAMLKMKNEDSMFFWTSLGPKVPQQQMDILRTRYAEWAINEHGSLAEAIDSWGGAKLKGDSDKQLGFYDVYTMTLPNKGGKRMQDQLRFLGELQREFYTDMVHFLKEDLGSKQLTASQSWKTASKLLLEDIERWTYGVNDVLTQNVYFNGTHLGKNGTWRIEPGDHIVNKSVTGQPWLLPTNIKQAVGQPTILTEVAWPNPNRYQSEGPLMCAAHQCLTDLAVTCWFGASSPEWDAKPFFAFDKKPQGHLFKKWTAHHPMQGGYVPRCGINASPSGG